MANYFVRRQSKVFGPVLGQQIVDLAKSGKIGPADEIANDRNGPWRPATSIGALQSVFGQTGPDPQPRASAPFQSAVQRPGQPKVARGVSLNAQLKEFGMGTSSVHMGNGWWFLSVLLFPLVTVFFIILAKNYGRPTICKVPLARADVRVCEESFPHRRPALVLHHMASGISTRGARFKG